MEHIQGEHIRQSFIFYRSFREAIDQLEAGERLAMYEAITGYALDGVEPQLIGTSKIMWTFVKPLLDANWRKYRNGCKGAEHGYKGGAPEGNTNAKKEKSIFPEVPKTTPRQPQNNPKTTRNDNVNDNE